MSFIANTPRQQKEMLRDIGLSMDDLFADVPAELRAKKLDLPRAKSEMDVRAHLQELSEKNSTHLTCFLGGGFYDHFIPAALHAILSRGEFYTAYTPYQPEVSQGTLQGIYEYQSMICRLTEMETANASLYDGGTALYEAMMMALRITGREKVIIDDSVNPIYRKMIKTYVQNIDIELYENHCDQGHVDRDAIFEQLDNKTAAVILQNPNFFGCIDDFTDIARAAHEKGALLIVSAYPISLGILKTPGAMGADIVTGEGQSLGIDLSFGGPYLGFMATRKKHIRKMPGRIVGQTTDDRGRTGYVMTLQAREQHIRRAKATSNICSNEGLCALAALIYVSLLGKEGLRQTAQLCADKASYAYQRLIKIPGITPHFKTGSYPNTSKNGVARLVNGKNEGFGISHKWFFNEFVLDLPYDASDVIGRLIEKGFAAGFPLSRYYKGMEKSILIAVTEKRTKEEIGMLAEALEAVL